MFLLVRILMATFADDQAAARAGQAVQLSPPGWVWAFDARCDVESLWPNRDSLVEAAAQLKSALEEEERDEAASGNPRPTAASPAS